MILEISLSKFVSKVDEKKTYYTLFFSPLIVSMNEINS